MPRRCSRVGVFAQDCQRRGLRYSPGVIRNIIFDWSGTLVDDLPAVWAATNHVLRQAGIPEMTLERFRAEFCLPFTRFYERYTPDVPLAQLEEWFHGHFREAQDSVQPLPHAREFLEVHAGHGRRGLAEECCERQVGVHHASVPGTRRPADS